VVSMAMNLRNPVLFGLICMVPVSANSIAQPPGGIPGAERPRVPGQGDVRFIEVDVEHDLNLLAIKNSFMLSPVQFQSVAKLYKEFRANQFRVVQEVMQEGDRNRSSNSERPSPEVRARQEAILKSKIDPINARFF